ncbi:MULTISPECIES: dihydroneopterin aldolase [Paenisporosarcina]|uniref:7,8-dihydroneopterin aldolase n=1 Tax=Paenisporosarcina antarctica TaxID=417367 RepID=A0A4P7A2T8_9BACL|nr:MULTISPECIES: dihydroneopterin aldolase [Paenisporosarcina]QBP42998.1 dihydroneopterin aldolase [Paenisporosarcina antarctica]
MDYIHVNEMEFWGNHGVFAEETKLGQRFRVTLSLAVDLQEAGQTDDLEKTVNYAEAFFICQKIVETNPAKLVETVAERIATEILTKFKGRVKGCKVMVIKPDPPIPGHYRSIAVEITRGEFV